MLLEDHVIQEVGGELDAPVGFRSEHLRAGARPVQRRPEDGERIVTMHGADRRLRQTGRHDLNGSVVMAEHVAVAGRGR